MDPEAFLDIANQVVKLKMFPYFDIAHCTLCALAVREDLGSDNWTMVDPRTKERSFFSVVMMFQHLVIWVSLRLSEKFIKMKADVNYVKHCTYCAQDKVEQKPPASLMGERLDITESFRALSLDYIGSLPPSRKGFCYIPVISDYFSTSAYLFPCRSAKDTRQPDTRYQTTTYEIPDTRYQTPDTRYQIPDTRHQIPDIRYQIPDTRYQIPDTRYQTTRYQIPDNQIPRYQIPDTRYQTPYTRHQISDTKYQVPDTRYQILIPDTRHHRPDTRH
ncbi:unnamed protein product [Acanthoscelides obtectus]|uniref:Uncharacterized protein n=1 Tax=Acanthoscelides obtectus TaxID=200917 RepID=A0A9P0QFT1_ACAOB|nr:unnamed protein product [Acanthoscelides obtectus]CAK1689112.1 hypothetical protein AOBTE_LOCUS37015 [Acanthoscelides obtectus]